MAKIPRPLVDWLSGYKVAENEPPTGPDRTGAAPPDMTDEVMNVAATGRMFEARFLMG